MKGVKHYKKDCSVFNGNTHKMNDGSLHSGKTHTASSVKRVHYGELSKQAKTKAKKSWSR